jgi:hypothetical protein
MPQILTMKKLGKYLVAAMLLGTTVSANAQYYAIADRLSNMISPALFGGVNYHGIVEVSAIKGIGENNGDFVGISTSQGFKYADWLFMGIGIGVDALFTHVDNYPDIYDRTQSVTKNGWIIPLFTDFRFMLGNTSSVNYYIGTKIGCSFLVSDDEIHVNRGYITSDECFYLKPSIGIRIPAGPTDHTALNIAVSYQLITPGYNRYDYSNNESISLNGFGLTIGYEW